MKHDFENLKKERKGLSRIWHALGYSWAGLKQAIHEPAFWLEFKLAIALIPIGFWLGNNWVESSLLIGSVLGVMIVELLNTGIETAIDRIGPEFHDLSKRAKDLGSAAVLLSLLLCGGIWLAAIVHRWMI